MRNSTLTLNTFFARLRVAELQSCKVAGASVYICGNCNAFGIFLFTSTLRIPCILYYVCGCVCVTLYMNACDHTSFVRAHVFFFLLSFVVLRTLSKDKWWSLLCIYYFLRDVCVCVDCVCIGRNRCRCHCFTSIKIVGTNRTMAVWRYMWMSSSSI